METETTDPAELDQSFDQWVILELFGHKRLAGRARAVEIGGCSFIRIDCPHADGESTHFYGNGAIYGMHPVTEDIARSHAAIISSAPVSEWDYPNEVKAALEHHRGVEGARMAVETTYGEGAGDDAHFDLGHDEDLDGDGPDAVDYDTPY